MIIQVDNIDKYVDKDTNIAAYLSRVVRGNSDVYRTPFYDGKDQETVLSTWAKFLGPVKNEHPSLWDFENDLRKKVGPLSVMQPLDKRIADVESYYSAIEKDAKPLSQESIAHALSEWESVAHDSIVCQSQRDTAQQMKLSTNSGTPYFTKRRDVLAQTIPVGDVNQDQLTYTLPGWSGPISAVLGWRGQEGGPNPDDVKQRVVWMFPFGVNVLEQTLYQPLIRSFQKHGLVPAWISNDYVDRTITQLFDSKAPEDLVVCTDFTKFDQHFNPTLAASAKTLIQGLVRDHSVNARWIEQVFPIKYRIPMILSENLIAVGEHGMGSGSGGTNFDETLVHRALQHEAACMRGESLNLYSQCLGDDGIISYPGITIADVVDSYSSHGLEMNTDKQYAATDHCVYLRRWHHADYRIDGKCVGVYSTFRALGRLMYQERYYSNWSEKMVALRQLSIIENVKYHPMREKFAEFCMKGDKYRLGIDIPGFLTNIEREVQEATDYMPDFLGYVRTEMDDTSIKHWWIYQYLMKRSR